MKRFILNDTPEMVHSSTDAYGFSYDMTEPQIVAELMKMYQILTGGES